MPDEFDQLAEKELIADAAIHSFRFDIPVGEAGECCECEEYSPRLIGGKCAPCRDGRR
jgi:hypothetical protein